MICSLLTIAFKRPVLVVDVLDLEEWGGSFSFRCSLIIHMGFDCYQND